MGLLIARAEERRAAYRRRRPAWMMPIFCILTDALQHSNHEVLKVEVEPWDRAELARLMREQSEVAGERLLRILAALSKDPDDAMLVEQAVNDILAEALQSRTSDIHLSLQEDDARCWIRYRIDGDLVYKLSLFPTA